MPQITKMPRLPKMQHCFNCGAETGVHVSYQGDLECCGKPECAKEERNAYREREESAREAAAEDGYSRYGGGF